MWNALVRRLAWLVDWLATIVLRLVAGAVVGVAIGALVGLAAAVWSGWDAAAVGAFVGALIGLYAGFKALVLYGSRSDRITVAGAIRRRLRRSAPPPCSVVAHERIPRRSG